MFAYNGLGGMGLALMPETLNTPQRSNALLTVDTCPATIEIAQKNTGKSRVYGILAEYKARFKNINKHINLAHLISESFVKRIQDALVNLQAAFYNLPAKRVIQSTIGPGLEKAQAGQGLLELILPVAALFFACGIGESILGIDITTITATQTPSPVATPGPTSEAMQTAAHQGWRAVSLVIGLVLAGIVGSVLLMIVNSLTGQAPHAPKHKK